MAHYRNLRIDERFNLGDAFTATFKLDSARAGTNEFRCISQCVLDRHVIAHPRQVTHDELFWIGSGDGCGVVRHDIDGDRKGVAVPEHDHRQRIANQDHVGVGFANHAGRRVIRRGDHHDGGCPMLNLASAQRRRRQSFNHADYPQCTAVQHRRTPFGCPQLVQVYGPARWFLLGSAPLRITRNRCVFQPMGSSAVGLFSRCLSWSWCTRPFKRRTTHQMVP